MRLSDALRLEAGFSVAFTGAGGKSHSLQRLVLEEVFQPVVLATTTKIFRFQSDIAAEHRILTEYAQLSSLREVLRKSASLFLTGEEVEDQLKWSGVPLELMGSVVAAVREVGGLLVVEADGARGGSLKAPAEHEPQIPTNINLVVPIAGIDVIGEPLESTLVHRPHLVTAIAGSVDRITPEVVARVLRSSQGGLKGVPQGGRIRVLINKVEDEEKLQQARKIAGLLLEEPRIEAVVLGAVSQEDPVQEVIGRTAGIVLAAGAAERFGSPKQLLDWDGKPFVRRVAETALQAGLSPVVVVTGAYGGQVREAVRGLGVEIVDNEAWVSGQGSSVRAGAAALPDSVEAACFMLADMPAVSEDLLRALIHRFQQTLASIVAPVYQGKRGNPVVFDRRTFRDLHNLSGAEGGQQLFKKYTIESVSWDDSILVDIDTPEDYRRLKR